jgi:hypothetical protein
VVWKNITHNNYSPTIVLHFFLRRWFSVARANSAPLVAYYPSFFAIQQTMKVMVFALL